MVVDQEKKTGQMKMEGPHRTCSEEISATKQRIQVITIIIITTTIITSQSLSKAVSIHCAFHPIQPARHITTITITIIITPRTHIHPTIITTTPRVRCLCHENRPSPLPTQPS